MIHYLLTLVLWFVEDAGEPPLVEGISGSGNFSVEWPAVAEVRFGWDNGGVVLVETVIVGCKGGSGVSNVWLIKADAYVGGIERRNEAVKAVHFGKFGKSVDWVLVGFGGKPYDSEWGEVV